MVVEARLPARDSKPLLVRLRADSEVEAKSTEERRRQWSGEESSGSGSWWCGCRSSGRGRDVHFPVS